MKFTDLELYHLKGEWQHILPENNFIVDFTLQIDINCISLGETIITYSRVNKLL